MKDVSKKIATLILTGFLLVSVSQAQNIDTNRMNRDIKIMENILEELFKIDKSDSRLKGDFRVLTTRSGISEVEGTYLPGYGIIFKIPQLVDTRISSISINRENGDKQISFYYDSDETEGSDQITEESIVSRITEFLKDYASTIGQLSEDENVMIMYGAKSERNAFFAVYTMNGDVKDEGDKEPLPVISVVASKKDLNALRSGSITEKAFKDRLKISKAQDKEYLDLKVMSNIFETALKETPKESFRLSGSVDYLMLENFGALFSMNVRYNTPGLASTFFFSGDTKRQVTLSAIPDEKNNSEEDEEQRKEKLEEAYQNLKTDIREYLIDYGRTLSSVQSGQHILTSVNISGSWIDNELPDRADFQVKKSILEQLDRGQISRQEAINSITVTEY